MQNSIPKKNFKNCWILKGFTVNVCQNFSFFFLPSLNRSSWKRRHLWCIQWTENVWWMFLCNTVTMMLVLHFVTLINNCLIALSPDFSHQAAIQDAAKIFMDTNTDTVRCVFSFNIIVLNVIGMVTSQTIALLKK